MHILRKTIIFTITIYVCFFVAPTITHAINSGFVNGIWYSSNPFFADQTVRIYAAIYNNNPFDIRGVVDFQDGDQVIGSSSFTALSGRTEEVWTDWKATYGQHRLSAVFTKMEKLEIGKEPVPMTWEGSTMADQPFVNIDPNAPATSTATMADPTTINQPNSLLNDINNTITNNSSTITQLIGGEKIHSLTSGLQFLQKISAVESALATKVDDLLAKQQSKTPTLATGDAPSSTIQWQDVTSTNGWFDKIYNTVLNILLFLLKLPPLLLIIGIVVIFLFFLRLWIKIRRWRRDRY